MHNTDTAFAHEGATCHQGGPAAAAAGEEEGVAVAGEEEGVAAAASSVDYALIMSSGRKIKPFFPAKIEDTQRWGWGRDRRYFQQGMGSR